MAVTMPIGSAYRSLPDLSSQQRGVRTAPAPPPAAATGYTPGLRYAFFARYPIFAYNCRICKLIVKSLVYIFYIC